MKKEDNLFLELAGGGSFCKGNASSWPVSLPLRLATTHITGRQYNRSKQASEPASTYIIMNRIHSNYQYNLNIESSIQLSLKASFYSTVPTKGKQCSIPGTHGEARTILSVFVLITLKKGILSYKLINHTESVLLVI